MFLTRLQILILTPEMQALVVKSMPASGLSISGWLQRAISREDEHAGPSHAVLVLFLVSFVNYEKSTHSSKAGRPVATGAAVAPQM